MQKPLSQGAWIHSQPEEPSSFSLHNTVPFGSHTYEVARTGRMSPLTEEDIKAQQGQGTYC